MRVEISLVGEVRLGSRCILGGISPPAAAFSLAPCRRGPCKSLVSIDSPLDFSRVSSNMDTTFTTCSALQEMRFTGTIKADLWVNGCSALSVDSLLSILNALVDFSATGGTHKLTLGTRNKAKLTAEQLQIAYDKGWTLP